MHRHELRRARRRNRLAGAADAGRVLQTPQHTLRTERPAASPAWRRKVDWEVELGVVIGRRARYLSSVDEALAYVAGYVTSHDVSERAFQLEQSGGQWSKGKCCEEFNPLGPWFVPAEAVAVPQALRLQSWVNGEPRQDSSTADMIFGVAYLVWHLSQYMVLEPGDLVGVAST